MRILFVILYIFITSLLLGQSLNYRTLTNKDGMSGNEVYSITEGDGELWMSCEGGNICNYNGFKIECISPIELGMGTGHKGITYSHELVHVIDVSERKYLIYDGEHWKQIPDVIVHSNFGSGALFYDSLNVLRRYIWTGGEFEKVVVADNQKGLLTKEKVSKGKISNSIGEGIIYDLDYVGNKVISAKDERLLGSSYIGGRTFLTNKGDLIYVPFGTAPIILPSWFESQSSFFIVENTDEFIYTKNNKHLVFSAENKKHIAQFKEKGLGYYRKTKHFYTNPDHNGLPFHSKGIRFFEAGEGNMVGSTHIVGEDNLGNIWFGGYKTGLSRFDGTDLTVFKNNSRIDNLMTGTVMLNDERIFITEDYGYLLSLKDGNIKKKSTLFNSDSRFTGYDIKLLSNNTIGVGTYKMGLGLIDADKLFEDTIRLIGKGQGVDLDFMFCLAEDSNKRVWMASQSEGLALYDRRSNDGKTFPIQEMSQKRFGITSLHYDEQNTLWIGSFSGLFVIRNAHLFDFENYDPYDFMEKVALAPFEGNTTSILQKDSLLIVGAEREVWFVNMNSFYDDPLNFDAYTYSYKHDLEGRTSEENGGLIDSKGNIWIGTQEGYLAFDLNALRFDSTLVDVYLDSYQIADSTYELKSSTLELPPENRNFSYSYNVKYNPSLRNNIYIYSSIVDANNDTLFTELYDPLKSQNRFFLEPGKYMLVAQTYKNNKLIDSDVYKINAQVYLTEAVWFWPLLSGVSLLSLFLFLFQRNKKEKLLAIQNLELEKLKQAQTQTQLQSIISSFNPHFINNSLHWAQSRYSHDKTLVKVIGRLSENIEHVFMKTKNGIAYHTLKEELKLVENYVEIQKVRFKDSFVYKCPPNAHSYSSFQLPIMQLQIHVENAIEHGLRNRVKSKYVSIIIEDKDDEVVLTVEDDGIGRSGASKIGSRGTQSGTEMLGKVHRILNNQNDEHICQVYEDDVFGDYGTRAIITIPKSINYDLKEV